MPESPRWLISKRKFDEASILLTFGSKLNKRTLPEEFLKINDKFDVSIGRKSVY